MDYIAPIVCFLVGLGFAYLAGSRARLWSSGRWRRRLPVEDGAVRLDLLAGNGKRPRRQGAPGENAGAQATDEPEPADGGSGNGLARRSRTRRRK